MYLTLACFVICCGLILTKILKDGEKMNEVYLILLVLTTYKCSAKNMI